jgi:predicted transposase YbfD/YdcC
MATSSLSVCRFFFPLRDPRRRHLRKHLLMDIVVIALCAVIAGANDWQQVVAFARARRDWLSTFLRLPHGIPSHDTFERVFDRLDPSAFAACFQRWIEALAARLQLRHIAIDGKTLRGSGNGPKGWKALHLVSAWATDCRLSLGQVAVDDKSNEITAIPQLLQLLDLHGALVTIDAMGCQREIAKTVVDGGGDYVFTVKDNQPHLLEDISACVSRMLEAEGDDAKYETWETEERGHGREEARLYLTVTDPQGIRNQEAWAGLSVIGMCVRTRVVQGKRSQELHYFMGSRRMSARAYGEALRGHWGIENNLHWQLDVTFAEDDSRVKRRHGAENLALLRRLALTLLQRHGGKESMACKRYMATLDTAFLEEILAAGCNSGKA